jgi:hypothetical protein
MTMQVCDAYNGLDDCDALSVNDVSDDRDVHDSLDDWMSWMSIMSFEPHRVPKRYFPKVVQSLPNPGYEKKLRSLQIRSVSTTLLVCSSVKVSQ